LTLRVAHIFDWVSQLHVNREDERWGQTWLQSQCGSSATESISYWHHCWQWASDERQCPWPFQLWTLPT